MGNGFSSGRRVYFLIHDLPAIAGPSSSIHEVSDTIDSSFLIHCTWDIRKSGLTRTFLSTGPLRFHSFDVSAHVTVLMSSRSTYFHTVLQYDSNIPRASWLVRDNVKRVQPNRIWIRLSLVGTATTEETYEVWARTKLTWMWQRCRQGKQKCDSDKQIWRDL
jgi:hypothetical protein